MTPGLAAEARRHGGVAPLRLLTARLVVVGACLALPTAGRAELALLDTGAVLHVAERRLGDGCVELVLREGGSVCLAPGSIAGFFPDEVGEATAAVAVVSPEGDLRALTVAAARRHGVDPDLLLSLVRVESGFVPTAVSAKGAAGLAQLMPATAKELGVRDVFDPAQNVEGGARYLARLLERYGGDLERSLAAYNAGPAVVDRHGGVPPWPETTRYVRAVLAGAGSPAP